jgi:hypothetical protein
MKTYLVKWANGDFSILTAENEYDLFWAVDQEGDPTGFKTKVYELPEYFHIAFEKNVKGKFVSNFINYPEGKKKVKFQSAESYY